MSPRRLSGYFTVKNATGLADLAIRVGAVVAAAAILAFFVLRPDVRLKTHMQPFIDTAALDKTYADQGREVPQLVRDVASSYNEQNNADLNTGTNPSVHKLPVADLCTAHRVLVESVFAGTDCTQPPARVGRNRYYERLLLDRTIATADLGTPEQVAATATAVQAAITNLQAAEYLRARVTLENRGLGKAVKTTVRVSNGFAPLPNVANDPFVLGPHDEVDRFFETSRGVRGRVLTPSRPGSPAGDPVVQFGVSWDRSPNPLDDLQIELWLGIVIVALIVAGVVALAVNDIRVATDTPPTTPPTPPSPDPQDQSRKPVTKRTRLTGPPRE